MPCEGFYWSLRPFPNNRFSGNLTQPFIQESRFEWNSDMLQSRTKKLLYLNNKINNRRHHKISEVTELSVTVVYYYYFYFMNIRGVIYWEFFLQWWEILRRQFLNKRIAKKHWNINQFLVSIPLYKTINNGFPNKVIEAICNLLFVYWQTQSC